MVVGWEEGWVVGEGENGMMSPATDVPWIKETCACASTGTAECKRWLECFTG